MRLSDVQKHFYQEQIDILMPIYVDQMSEDN